MEPKTVITTVLIVAALFSAGCTGGDGGGQYRNQGGGNGGGASITAIPAGSLNATEAADILYMREEEKLARDSYTYFYGLLGAQIFSNIAESEQTHMDAVATLINRYGLDDPASPTAGTFTNATLQALYDRLTAEGSASEIAALEAAALIEETDIADLQTATARTDNADARQVYASLMQGSENHLRAFVRNLGQWGVEYRPVVLSEEDYKTVINGRTLSG
jgi:hypothetical protein